MSNANTTDEQIKALRALDDLESTPWNGTASAKLADLGYNPNEPDRCHALARAECARVIAENEAQS